MVQVFDKYGRLKVISPSSGGGGVSSVSAILPITSTGGTTPFISTSMATNKLIGRSTAGVGVMEEITIGSGLTLSAGTLTASGAVTPNALTRTNDTNVTLTLGGTPNTALLQATSLTLGWTGTLADSRITSASNWNTAYTNRITSLTTTGSGAATLISNVLNIPTPATFTSPLTTKGDLFTYSTTNIRLPIGSNNQILTVDTSTATGLKWAAPPTATPTGYYGGWQDNVTQTAAASNTGYAMIFRTIDLANGVSVVTNGTNLTRITFANTGIYNLQFSSQFQNADNAQHDVTIWLRLNGANVAGSSGLVSVPARKSAGAGNEGHVIAGWNYLLSVVAGQYYELMWSTSNATNVTMQFYSAGSPSPSAASVIMTVTQQSGIMAGTGMTSLTTTGTSGAATYNSGTGVLNIPQYTGGGGSGITSLNGLTGTTQTFSVGTSGTNFAISSTGTVHTFNLPDASSTARGVITTGSQDINGTKNFLTDIIVNGVNIGAGPGNVSSNVRIGRQAGNSLTTGTHNIFIGDTAANIANTIGSTVIGSNATPLNGGFNQDYTLNIGKKSSLFGPTTQPPQFWSPDRIPVDGNTNDIILRMTNELYSAVFIDYVISYEDTSLRAGTIKAVWDKNGVVKWTEDSTDSIGDMSTAVFDVDYDAMGGFVFLRLTNNSGTRVYCNFTSRLLLKPILY